VNTPEPRTPPRAPNEPPTMEQAVLRAAREATLAHARAGNPVAGVRDGEVVWLTPEEVFAQLGVDANGHATTQDENLA
jgi:hypothetical protein